MDTEVKVLGLAKTLTDFLKMQLTTEEDFNPTLSCNDFGVKVESVEKFQESFYR
jgi:hypothetical protein